MPCTELKQLKELHNQEEAVKYKVRTKFKLPKDLENQIKEKLKDYVMQINNPVWGYYDYASKRIKTRQEVLKMSKKIILNNVQVYTMKMNEEQIFVTRNSVKCKTSYSKEDYTITIEFSLNNDDGNYSYYTPFIGKSGTSYFYNENTKRKLSTDQKFSIWSECNIINISEDILNHEEVRKTSFDKLVKQVMKNDGPHRVSSSVVLCLKYFKYREKFPEIDNLIQKDLPDVTSLISDRRNLYDYFFKGNSFKKNFILPKDCLEPIIELGKTNSNDLYNLMGYFNQIQFTTKAVTKEIVEKLISLYRKSRNNYYYGSSFFQNVKSVVVDYGIDIKQVIAYLERVDDYQAILPLDAISLWKDYLESARKLGLTDFDKYPNSLKREHDVFAREAVRVRNEREEQDFEEAMSKYQDITFEDDKYCIVVPKKAEDLINEGKELNHCVGTYVSRVAQKRTTIFFVREKENKEKSLYTLEVKDGMNNQFRGKYNCKPQNDAFKFADRFIEEIINKNYLEGEVASLAM